MKFFCFSPSSPSCVPRRSNFGRKFAPDSLHTPTNGVSEGAFTYLNWGLVMRPAYPPDRKQKFLHELPLDNDLPLDDEHDAEDETSDSVMSLLEENARLRGLVVKLTDLILKNVADRG